jgi:hypothetical protein
MASGEEEGLFDFLPEQAAPERVGGGLPRLRFAERMQTRWRPVSVDGLLPDDHRVRLVWSFVEGLTDPKQTQFLPCIASTTRHGRDRRAPLAA